jgi:hypothetical protein
MEIIRSMVEIDQEIEDFKIRYGDTWLGQYTNNFVYKLPEDEANPDEDKPLGFHRRASLLLGTLDTPIRSVLAGSVVLERCSNLYLDMTYRDFYRTIDDALRENGLAVDDLEEIYARDCQTRSGSYNLTPLKLAVLPAFKTLQIQGLNRYELGL